MKLLLRSIACRFLLLSQFLILTFSCDVPEYSPYPDYTGQTGHIADIEGHVYNTMGIGSQIWMVENLNTTKLNDGTHITPVLDDSLWNRIKSPGYCWYNNDSLTNRKIYGALYNFLQLKPDYFARPDGMFLISLNGRHCRLFWEEMTLLVAN